MDDSINRQLAIDTLNQAKKVMLSMFEALPKNEEAKMRMEIICGVVDSIKPFLEKVPPAQPEIIHCGECKYHRYDSKGIPYCGRIDYGYGWKDNDFCSRAERRTND